MRGTAVRPRSDEVCVNITFKAFMSVDARFALNSCRSRIGNVTIRSRQTEKSSPCDLGCRISAFTILSYTYTHVSRAAQQKPPKNTPLFPWHFLLPDVHLKPGLLCLFLRKCYYYLNEERDEWAICTIDIKKLTWPRLFAPLSIPFQKISTFSVTSCSISGSETPGCNDGLVVLVEQCET
jgi:hypothetical protein